MPLLLLALSDKQRMRHLQKCDRQAFSATNSQTTLAAFYRREDKSSRINLEVKLHSLAIPSKLELERFDHDATWPYTELFELSYVSQLIGGSAGIF